MKFRVRLKLPEIEFEISKKFVFFVGRYKVLGYWDYIFIDFGCFTLRVGKLI